ncbi:flagellar biosynthesis regulator FlaF [Asticcacaulis sp. DW145]|jgi:flagellar protein FlaF|uniref:Flagellar biosynthesis regulator FlaF n=1 Tax=Asticcacaulis currens TaxID=2984210 RepID=A0ABT5IGE7_9CAUL|nr:flagellar biosynthesis regulator FlaF [Asticcacaulis currens]MDC7695254.1 flagellar biosynthesis regulator FlaF [Asticcacaulis currens]BEV12617.1 flagellar biosynthesis regulator FlaF [Asticcacaulis sp. DW145]
MSLQAYQKTAQRNEDPRQTEYRLFGQVTRALMEAAELDRSEVARRMDALDWNRRLWSVLGTDCALPGNGLPDALRAQIISLSIWVNRHTSAVMRGQEEITPLIEVNRLIMQGLMPRQDQAPAAESAFVGTVRASLG